MSESNLPPPPDDEDRELEAFLAGRSELSRLYRDTAKSETAPAALDTAVLAEAREAVATVPPRRQTRLRRWRLPLSLAASMVVGIGVLREVRQDPALQQQVSGEAAAVAAYAKAEQRAAARVEAAPVVASPPAPLEFSTASPRSPDPSAMPAPKASSSEAAGPEVRALRKEKLLPPAPVEPPVTSAPALAEAPALQPGLAAGGASSDSPAAIPEVPAAEPAQAQKRALMRQDEARAMPSPLPPPAAERAAAPASAPASAPVAAAKAAVVEAWQPARYQGRTLAIWARDHEGPATVTAAPSATGKIAAESMADAVENEGDVAWIDYGSAVDPRGVLRGRLAADRQLALLSLNLSPALPLSVVEASEQLGRADAACADRRRYPAQGIELRLDAEGQVAEIRYHRLPPPACR